MVTGQAVATAIASRDNSRANRLEKLEVTYVPTDTIRPNSYNPNQQDERDFALLLASIEADGFTQPVIAQKHTGEIVDGEHRWRAAKQLGMPKIPVVLTDMSPEQMRIATLRHNRARGSENADLTANVLRELAELDALDWAQTSLLLSDDEINRYIDELPEPAELLPSEPEPIHQVPQAYRLVLNYRGEQAELLHEILGDQTAKNLLTLCQQEADRLDNFEEP